MSLVSRQSKVVGRVNDFIKSCVLIEVTTSPPLPQLNLLASRQAGYTLYKLEVFEQFFATGSVNLVASNILWIILLLFQPLLRYIMAAISSNGDTGAITSLIHGDGLDSLLQSATTTMINLVSVKISSKVSHDPRQQKKSNQLYSRFSST